MPSDKLLLKKYLNVNKIAKTERKPLVGQVRIHSESSSVFGKSPDESVSGQMALRFVPSDPGVCVQGWLWSWGGLCR